MTGAGAVGAGLLAVLVGTLILADVSGPRAAAPPRAVLTAHVLVALLGLGVLAAGAITGGTALSWAAVAVLGGAGTFGIIALRRTLNLAGTTDRTRPSNVILIVHGAAAAATIALALAAAATR